MKYRLALLTLAVVILLLASDRSPSGRPAAALLEPLITSTEPAEFCLMPEEPRATAQAEAAAARPSASTVPPDWPSRPVLGGDIPPVRAVYDMYPIFDGIAVDPDNGVVVMTDENLGGLLQYDTTSGSLGDPATAPKRHVYGPRANLGYMAGVALDPIRREIIAINNDGGGLVVHAYDAHGDEAPVRRLNPPHQSWGISLDLKNDEMAITSQQYQGISIFRRGATGAERPLRTIRGMETGLSDPHGVYLDGRSDEVFTSNHGNWTEMRSYAADGPPVLPGEYVPGRFEQPAIQVHRASANGNVEPKRTIRGTRTQLNWPMGIDMDTRANEIAVANYGTSSILFFPKNTAGDVPPSRILGGSRTGIVGPVGVAIDHQRNEIWVANYGDHTAVVFDRDASGNTAPKRIIRNAPAGTPTTGFTNAAAAAYDTKRDELLVPN